MSPDWLGSPQHVVGGAVVATAYYDTVADLTATLAGGVVGAVAGTWVSVRRNAR